jgi:hypothetical protein
MAVNFVQNFAHGATVVKAKAILGYGKVPIEYVW